MCSSKRVCAPSEAAATYIEAVQAAANAQAPSRSPALFDIYEVVAAQVLSRPEMDPDVPRRLQRVAPPARVLAAMFLQRKLADTPSFAAATTEHLQHFVEALAKADPMLVVWIAQAVMHVAPVRQP